MRKIVMLLIILLTVTGKLLANDVVAVVNSQKIYKQEIKTKGAIKQLKIRYPDLKKRDLKKKRFEMEVKSLAAKIRQIIAKQERERFSLSASPKEINAKWEEMIKGADIQQGIIKRREEMTPLLNALKAVYEEKQSPDSVYAAQLAEIMPKEAWQVQLAAYSKPFYRRLLEEELKKGAEDYRNPPSGLEWTILSEKFNAAIDAEIGASDPDFAKYKQLIEQGAYNEAEAFKGPFYIETKRQEWWKDKYKKAKIEILDPKYKGALDLLYVS